MKQLIPSLPFNGIGKWKIIFLMLGAFLAIQIKAISQTNTSYKANTVPVKGEYNSAFGVDALITNTAGWYNTGIGNSALYKNTTGVKNTAVGDLSISFNSNGSWNTAMGASSLAGNDIGNKNTANGSFALVSNIAGSNATAIGYGAMQYSNNTKTAFENYNVAVGYEALRGSTKPEDNIGNKNTAIGYRALYSNTSGNNNTANGYLSMYSNTSGYQNTAMGREALYFNTTGNDNTAIGMQSLYKNKTGSGNTGIGQKALNSNIDGDNNTAIGVSALFKNQSGGSNTSVGLSSLFNNISGYDNTAIGTSALIGNTTGYENVAMGKFSLYNNKTGNNNTALGYHANVAADNLTNATAIGANAVVNASNTIQLGNSNVSKIFAGVGKATTVVTGGLQITGGVPATGKVLTSDANGIATWQTPAVTAWGLKGNTGTLPYANFIGTIDNQALSIKVNNINAGKIDPVANNTFLGYHAGDHTYKYLSTGKNNTAYGYLALSSNVLGSNATAIGAKAMQYTNNEAAFEFENYNIAVGYEALRGSEDPVANTGNYNTAIGYQTLLSNTTGFQNITSGHQTLYSNTTGNNNVANGYRALYTNTEGSLNTAIGTAALFTNTKGKGNTADGVYALMFNTEGNYNTAIGYNAGVTAPALNNTTAIGVNAKVSKDNCLVLGGTDLYAVNVGIGTPAPAYQLQLTTNSAAKPLSNVWTIASDRRLKKDVTPFTDGLNILKQINPVWFTYTGEAGMPANAKAVGIIAQEMQKIAPYTVGAFIYQDTSGRKKEYLDYDGNAVTYMLINAIKEQQQQIDALQKMLEKLTSTSTIVTTPGISSTNIELNDKNYITLDQNIPNPFTTQTTIVYDIPANANTAKILFYNANGQLIRTANILAKGKGQLNVSAAKLSNGTYSYSLVVDGKMIDTKKMLKQ